MTSDLSAIDGQMIPHMPLQDVPDGLRALLAPGEEVFWIGETSHSAHSASETVQHQKNPMVPLVVIGLIIAGVLSIYGATIILIPAASLAALFAMRLGMRREDGAAEYDYALTSRRILKRRRSTGKLLQMPATGTLKDVLRSGTLVIYNPELRIAVRGEFFDGANAILMSGLADLIPAREALGHLTDFKRRGAMT